MDKQRNREFISKTESLVKPADVTAISFLGDFNKLLPVKTQQKVMKKGSMKIPYMGFIVDPYCLFISYRIKNEEAARKMLPDGYELLDTSLFADEEKAPSLIFSVFSARTSAFTGMRMEAYLIAQRMTDKKPAWIIIDYVTNTNSYDPAHGFAGYNSDPALFTTTPYGELLVDVGDRKRRLAFQADITAGAYKKLDYPLWVEGNMAVDYGGVLKDESSTVFSLIFDPALMEKALEIPLGALGVEENGFFKDLIDTKEPVSCACFPFSQHYIIKQDLKYGEIKTEADLEEKAAEFLSSQDFKTMRGDDLKKPIMISLIVSAILNYGVIVFLLIKLLS